MNAIVSILPRCPLCKSGLDEAQALGMEISIYIMLLLIYSLIGFIAYKIYRVMSKESRAAAAAAPPASPVPPPLENVRS